MAEPVKKSIDIVMAKENVAQAIVYALLHSEQSAARNLVIQRAKIISDLAESDCKYALHALFLTMVREDCKEIIAKMSADHIVALKNALGIAKSYACPDKAAAHKINNACSRKVSTKMSQYDTCMNNITRYSAIIAGHVADLWDDSIIELNKWSDAITGYRCMVPVAKVAESDKKANKKTKSKTKKMKKQHIIKADKKHWTLSELSERLGISVFVFSAIRRRISKDNPKLAKKIKSWFVRSNGIVGVSLKLFKARYFNELQKSIADYIKPNTKSPRPKLKSKVDLDEIVKTVIPGQPTDMTGVVGLEKLLGVLMKLYKDACTEQEKVDGEYRAIWTSVNECENPNERTKLLTQLQQVNDRLVDCTKKVADKKNEVDEATDLSRRLAQTEAAMQRTAEAARSAKQKWDETCAAVNAYVKFMTEYVDAKK